VDRRDLLKTAGGAFLLGGSGTLALRLLTTSSAGPPGKDSPLSGKKMGMVIDVRKCRPDCDECIRACRRENNIVPPAAHENHELAVHWIRKVTIRKKVETHAKAEKAEAAQKSVILVCNHCDNPPCAQVCPVQATFKREDGIVLVDHHRCIGCRYCMIACPYNARYFNFEDVEVPEEERNKDRPRRSHGVAEGCTLCAHRLDAVDQHGNPSPRPPACVEACKYGALTVGDLNDTTPSGQTEPSTVYELLRDNAAKRLKEDLGTEPKVHYIGL